MYDPFASVEIDTSEKEEDVMTITKDGEKIGRIPANFLMGIIIGFILTGFFKEL